MSRCHADLAADPCEDVSQFAEAEQWKGSASDDARSAGRDDAAEQYQRRAGFHPATQQVPAEGEEHEVNREEEGERTAQEGQNTGRAASVSGREGGHRRLAQGSADGTAPREGAGVPGSHAGQASACAAELGDNKVTRRPASSYGFRKLGSTPMLRSRAPSAALPEICSGSVLTNPLP
jgi:hypothetical protein